MKMIFRDKIPIKKSKDEIKFYIENGAKFGSILNTIYKSILLFKTIQDIPVYFKELCEKTFPNKDIEYPFYDQENINYDKFGSEICVSVNDCVAHGKYNRKFQREDIISIDCGIKISISSSNKLKYLTFDAAFTVQPSMEDVWINIPHKALCSIVNNNPKNTLDIAGIIEDTAKEASLLNVVSLTGHGIGASLHEPPVIHNARGDYIIDELFNGLCFCAEPIYVKSNQQKISKLIEKTYIDSDGWAIFTQSGASSSHFETMFAVINGQIVDLLKMTEWSLE